MKAHMPLRAWLPLLGLTFITFVFNTSEFMPIGLLSDIAASFQLTEAHAGLLISVYALVVMLTSLPLMLLASRLNYKPLLLGTIALFCLFQFLSAVSQSYALLMAARIGVALTHAIFWAIVSPLAVRIVPARFHSLALSLIATGTSIAMIAGMPLGRMIGLALGWRMSFAAIGASALAALIFLFFVFPRLQKAGSFSLSELPALLRNKTLIALYIFTLLLVTSYYTCYSYIEPFLAQIAGMSETHVTNTLIVYGACGLFGSFLYARCFDKAPIRFIRIDAVCMAAALFLLVPAAKSSLTAVLLCAFWGVTVTAFNVTFQGETIHVAPENAASIAMAIYSGIYNLGISAGSWLGGRITDAGALGSIGYISGALSLVAVSFGIFCFTRLLSSHYKAKA